MTRLVETASGALNSIGLENVGFDDFLKLAQGALDPTMAFMQGKLKVAGDMGVAMKLQSLFSKLK